MTRRVEWPAAGITGPGSWGTRDLLTWEHCANGVRIAFGGFVAGYMIETPADAHKVMRKCFAQSLKGAAKAGAK